MVSLWSAAGQAICAIASYECLSRISSCAAMGAMVLEALLSRIRLGAMIQVELRSTHAHCQLGCDRVFSSCRDVACRVHRYKGGLLNAKLSLDLSNLENPTLVDA